MKFYNFKTNTSNAQSSNTESNSSCKNLFVNCAHNALALCAFLFAVSFMSNVIIMSVVVLYVIMSIVSVMVIRYNSALKG